MTAKELLDMYLNSDFRIMKDPAMGEMVEIPYHTLIHIIEHYETIRSNKK